MTTQDPVDYEIFSLSVCKQQSFNGLILKVMLIALKTLLFIDVNGFNCPSMFESWVVSEIKFCLHF